MDSLSIGWIVGAMIYLTGEVSGSSPVFHSVRSQFQADSFSVPTLIQVQYFGNILKFSKSPHTVLRPFFNSSSSSEVR